MNLLQILLLGSGGQDQSPMSLFITFGMVAIVFYFFMIRPQMKKAKEQRNFKEEVKKGDKIVTLGGIYGKIAEIREDAFIIDVENGGKLKITKAAISMEYTNQAGKSK